MMYEVRLFDDQGAGEGISELIEQTANIKGEIVIVVEGNKEEINFESLTILEHIKLYMTEGMDSKEAIKQVAKDRKLTKDIVYKEYHQKQVKK